MRESQPIIITRGQIGHWASIAGGIALLVGILGLLWQGGLTPFIIGALVLGGAGIALWALMTPNDFTGFISGRQVRYGTTAVFSSLLLIGIVALVYILLQRAVITVDMTEGQRFTLSPETQRVLDNINRDIQITIFYSSRALPQREVDDQFFRLYEVASQGRIKRVYVDPDEQPGMAQRFGAYTEGSTFVSFLNPDGSVDFGTVAFVPRDPAAGTQERDMTQALLRLILSGTFTVYFETSHGEPDPRDTSAQGLSGINGGMRESGLITLPLNLAELAQNGGKIPEDASAVIMARPTTDLTVAEIQVVDEYLKRGGALFLMADVTFNDNPFLAQNAQFNQYLWENYGIRALDAAIVDAEANTRQSELEIVGAVAFTGTDIGARLDPANAPTVFRVARPLEINSDNPPTNNGRIIGTSESSYGETDLRSLGETNTYRYDDGQDIRGPMTVVAWSWDQETDARILLVGDGDFVTNGLVGTALGNGILFTDGMSWLTGLGERLKFAPQAFVTALPIFLDGGTLDIIALVTVVLMPLTVLVIGLAIWTRRIRQ